MAVQVPSILLKKFSYGNPYGDKERTTAAQFIAQVEADRAASGLSNWEYASRQSQEVKKALEAATYYTSNRPTGPTNKQVAGTFGAMAAGALTGGALQNAGMLGAPAGSGTLASVPTATPAAASGGMMWGGAPSTAGLFAPSGMVGTTAASGAAASGAGATATTAAAGGGGFWGGVGKMLGGSGGWGPVAVNAGLNVLGSYMASRAANQAAEQQMEFGRQALDFEKQRYADAQANFKPWITQGTNAVNTIGASLMPTDGSKAPTANNLAGQFNSGLLANAANNGRNMVQMKGPTGDVQAVPSYLVPHFQAKGATIVS